MKMKMSRYNFTEDGYRQRFRDVKPDTDEMPDQLVVRLKNYLARWLELSESSPVNFDTLVDLIVKEELISACSDE